MPTNIVIAIDDPSNRDAWGLRPRKPLAWAAGAYAEGTVVTHSGQAWIANAQTSETPGVGDDWTTLLPSFAGAAGALFPQANWNAAANSPALASGVGTEGYVYRVATAGNTTLDGVTAWSVDDLAVFLFGAWRKVRAGAIDAVDIADSTAAGRSVLTAADAAAARTALGLAAVAASGSHADLDVNTVPHCHPQGRLTLTSGAPVMASSVSGATTVYYAPYVGARIPLWDGAKIIFKPFGELSQATTDASKSPASVVANKNYDLFVWDDAGTLRLSRGPAWTNDTTRLLTLVRSGGILTNGSAITNGPALGRGTWVGTIRSNGSATVDFIYGGSAAGGGAAFLGVWNAYNRVVVSALVLDETSSWSYETAAWRAANNSTSNRVSYVSGAAEDAFEARYWCALTFGGGTWAYIGVAHDSTTPVGVNGVGLTASTYIVELTAFHAQIASLGWHYVQATENGNGSTGVFYNGAPAQGLHFQLRM